jgi:hypothetical protein
MNQSVPRVAITVAALSMAIGMSGWSGCSAIQQKFLFHPSHSTDNNGLTPWQPDGRLIGFSRIVRAPKNIWLMLHGNGGQASDRTYALPTFSPEDSVFILEYPGYGTRTGTPSIKSFNAAAAEAYLDLKRQFPTLPVCVAAESIGSGPASILANQPAPPDKIVLVVPFDTLQSVAFEHMPWLPVGVILGKSWDNVAALSQYRGPIEIFGAEEDAVIKITHAEGLARSLPRAQFHRISGGHNDWSRENRVRFHNP